MSRELCVDYYKDKTKKWYKMKAAWDACNEAGIDEPDEVSEYFGHEYPENEICGEPGKVSSKVISLCQQEINDDNEYGYLIILKELPEDIKYIKATLS